MTSANGALRRTVATAALALSLAGGLGGSIARAQDGVPGTGSIANEGHTTAAEPAECTARSTDAQCFEYWEDHINWWSWDYKPPYADAAHRHMPAPFGFAVINFAVFAYILYRLAARPLREFVRTRHTTVRHDLDEAARLNAEANARLREYEAKIAGLDGEIDALLAGVRREAEVEKARIIAAAEVQAKTLETDAQAQIAREVSRVRRELKTEAVQTAIAVAEQIIRQRASEADHVRIAERFVADLEGMPGSSSPPTPRASVAPATPGRVLS